MVLAPRVARWEASPTHMAAIGLSKVADRVRCRFGARFTLSCAIIEWLCCLVDMKREGWERLALKLAILMPPIALMVLVWLMAYEADYTFLTRIVFFGEGAPLPVHH